MTAPRADRVDPAEHYDRVTAAWTLLLGDDLHYGVFTAGDEDLATATNALTRLMIDAAGFEAENEMLDVGCGTGAPACLVASEHGVRVTGITTSPEGIRAAEARAQRDGVAELVRFELRDGMETGLPSESFDRVWALESSHLMRRRDSLIAECARLLRPGGRLVLCDIIRRRELDLQEVRRLREPLSLLKEAFGDARMEPLSVYRSLAEQNGLEVDHEVDLTQATRPTFARWRDNADRHREEVERLIGEDGRAKFRDSCAVLEGFWDDGTLGYGLIAARKPGG